MSITCCGVGQFSLQVIPDRSKSYLHFLVSIGNNQPCLGNDTHCAVAELIAPRNGNATLSYLWSGGQQNRQTVLNVGRHLTVNMHPFSVIAYGSDS